MPIYADVDYTIAVGPLTDAEDAPVVGAAVTARILRGEDELWTGSGTTDEDGALTLTVPDTLELVVGEILTERVEIVSGTLNDVRETRLRVLRRRG